MSQHRRSIAATLRPVCAVTLYALGMAVCVLFTDHLYGQSLDTISFKQVFVGLIGAIVGVLSIRVGYWNAANAWVSPAVIAGAMLATSGFRQGDVIPLIVGSCAAIVYCLVVRSRFWTYFPFPRKGKKGPTEDLL